MITKLHHIEAYGFPQEVVEKVRPIVDHPDTFRSTVTELTTQLCQEVKSGLLSSEKADLYFRLLYLYLSDQDTGVDLDEEVENLIVEGMHLHDLGQPFGADIERLIKLAQQILDVSVVGVEESFESFITGG